jgi:type IV secretory pathway TraG/TraD family ATPase VirD4
VGRSLLTPDEVMRLGEEEMLVFTAGHHAIRTAKLRHFRYPLFNQRVGLRPPAQSDSTVSAAPAIGVQEKANEAAWTAVVAVNGAQQEPGRQAAGLRPIGTVQQRPRSTTASTRSVF